MQRSELLTLTLAAVLLPATVHAVTIPLLATLHCTQANAGAGTCNAGGSGTGSASITLDTVSNVLSWNISWSGLSSTATGMHFHGPALPNQNATVQVGTGVAGPPVVGNAILTAGQAADLLAGLSYLNLHTSTFFLGEIRDQVVVVPEPAALLLVGAGLAGLAAVSRQGTG
jgi:hypothetical protein